MEERSYKERYKAGEFPECFVPCPPFYDICNRVNFVLEKCRECYQKYNFVDYVE